MKQRQRDISRIHFLGESGSLTQLKPVVNPLSLLKIIQLTTSRTLAATSHAGPLNLRFERPPTPSTWGSDNCISHSRDVPYGRTCHRCTCHQGARPWDETQGLKHNRGIELCLSFLASEVSTVEGFLPALRLRWSFLISLSCCCPALCNFWPFWRPSLVSGVWVVALEQLLDPLDGALQLMD
jgi:hypothetical protein